VARFLVVTLIEALPLAPLAAVAMMVPLPAAVALNVVGLPEIGEKVPREGTEGDTTDQLGETATAFP
jgi:hypothetical protein